jgi:integrase
MESPKIDNWLSRVSTKTARLYGYQFKGFMKWVKENGGAFRDYSPDDLLRHQQEADNGSKYDVLDLIQRYMLSQKDKRYRTLKGRYAAIRSFFQHNRAELPRDPSFRLKGDKPPIQKLLTVENVRDMCLAMNPTYRAIVLSMLQGGMGVSEFEAWNLTGLESLRAQLRKDPEFIRIDLPGRKKFRNILPFYTLIGSDAIEAIRAYFKIRPEGSEAIFVTQYGTPVKATSVSWMWLKKAKRIGIVQPENEGHQTRYGKHAHLIRMVFKSQWVKSGRSPTISKFFMGHQVDPLDYNRAFTDERWVKREYRSALPLLQIMSSGRPYGQVEEEEVEQLRIIAADQERKIKQLEARAPLSHDQIREIAREAAREQMELAERVNPTPTSPQ